MRKVIWDLKAKDLLYLYTQTFSLQWFTRKFRNNIALLKAISGFHTFCWHLDTSLSNAVPVSWLSGWGVGDPIVGTCWFPWCKYCHLGWLHASQPDIPEHGVGKSREELALLIWCKLALASHSAQGSCLVIIAIGKFNPCWKQTSSSSRIHSLALWPAFWSLFLLLFEAAQWISPLWTPDPLT